MTKTITKIGNSQGLMFDTALMEITHLKVGDQVTVSVHEGGSIIITPIRPVIDAERGASVAKRLIGKNSELFKRLS
jgi:antitoxin component of MazEF toxin-antitoxin module